MRDIFFLGGGGCGLLNFQIRIRNTALNNILQLPFSYSSMGISEAEAGSSASRRQSVEGSPFNYSFFITNTTLLLSVFLLFVYGPL